MKKKGIRIPEVIPQTQTNIVTQERHYSLITPLFGGGAIPGECDEVTVVRGTEIRGQLRFWWRACYGGRYETIAEMKKAEDLLWGTAATSKKDEQEKERVDEKKGEEEHLKKTTVQIVVEPIDVKLIKEKKLYTIGKDKKGKNQARPINKSMGYAAFPLQPSREELDASTNPIVRPVFDNVQFCLTISFPSDKQGDIEGALWAWETFGGIGARTRRGFGALQLKRVNGKEHTDTPSLDDPVQWIRDRISDLQTKCKPPVKGKAPENVPCLLPDMMMQSLIPKNATPAWEKAIEELLEYRQFPNGRTSQYGSSKWPEAETILTFTRKKIAPSQTPQKFPRAAFGLPIIFNFIGYPDLQKRPLQGANKNHDRLASPLILRPLICKDAKGKKEITIGLALVLENFSFPAGRARFYRAKWKSSPRRSTH